MQTNYLSNNQQGLINDFSFFISNDCYKFSNPFDSDKDKESQENEVKEEKSLNSINQEVKNFYNKGNIGEEIQKIMKTSLIGKKRKRRTASEIERLFWRLLNWLSLKYIKILLLFL